MSIAIIVDFMYLFYFIVYFLLMTFWITTETSICILLLKDVFIYILSLHCCFVYHFPLLPHIFKVIVNLLLLDHIFLCSYTPSSIFDIWIYLLSSILVLSCFVIISITCNNISSFIYIYTCSQFYFIVLKSLPITNFDISQWLCFAFVFFV